ncbi:serine/threonine protein kinase [Pseudoalteromonas luteoviolacea]|uniref:serine/threonine-protein kinase n=1 Tax=Pseudoalteromonas luteoviolacea TaxID=43657 RepID=UPI001F2BA3C8|nr:serine/threonine-protein kinase [Pseudoalteromonas luteoviolacea]MCF6442923.1 serine/threonine protein kinase [Pseudoalteromonas luteoviolacea]
MTFDDALSVFDYLLVHSPDNLTSGLKGIPNISFELTNEVTKLISAHEENARQTLFGSIIAEQINLLDGDKGLLSLTGERIQHFRLTSLLGSGGMGVVYLAERCDGQLEQQVAIKIIAPSVSLLTSKELAFKEAQHLARLNHPHIAKIYDVGTTQSDLIYLIMEYIEGESLQTFCAGRPSKEVLTLFIKVCDAVNYSHQNRIIHGDLKPENILVDKLGEPKLLDFGVAHTLSEQHNATYSAYINGLSKEYASPEQLAGKTLTTQSDVYSLGKLLLKLIDAPNKELLAIINKATAVERNERFISAADLAADIKNYRAHKAILWYKSDLIYLLHKKYQRAPVTVTLSVLAITLLTTISVLLFVSQQTKLTHAEEQQALLKFYQNLLASFTPDVPQGEHFTAADLLAYGSRQVDANKLNDKSKVQVKYTLARSLYVHGYYERVLNVLSGKIYNQATNELNALSLYQLKRLNDLLQQINELPEGSQKEQLNWLIIDTPNKLQQVKLIDFLVAEPFNELRLIILKRAIEKKWLTPSKIKKLLDVITDKVQSVRHQLWLNLFAIDIKANRDNPPLIQALNVLITQAEKTYHPLHGELAALHLLAAKSYSKLNDFSNQERSMNQAIYILEQLAPLHKNLHYQALLDQYRYYYATNDLYVARAFLSRAYSACNLLGPNCSTVLYDLVLLRAKLGETNSLQKDANIWLENNPVHSQRYFDVWLALNNSSTTMAPQSLNLPIESLKLMSISQMANWLTLLIKHHATEALTPDITDYLLKNASHNPLISQNLLAINRIAPNKLIEQKKVNLVATAKNYENSKNIFTLPDANIQITPNQYIQTIHFPKRDTVMTIGTSYDIAWDASKLPGNTLSLFINHGTHQPDNSYKQFSEIKTTRWKHAASNIVNNGKFTIDPYDFMANGTNKFKVLLASELGFWSLSDGLFSIASGIAKDNGLEHFFNPDLLVDAITFPKAFDIYTMGKTSEITWDPNKLQGKYLQFYVLHDNPKGLGNKTDVNIDTVYNKRWYLFSTHIANTGHYELDPALFNGRGNNYKLLVISDLGYWSVSEERFSVLFQRL